MVVRDYCPSVTVINWGMRALTRMTKQPRVTKPNETLLWKVTNSDERSQRLKVPTRTPWKANPYYTVFTARKR